MKTKAKQRMITVWLNEWGMGWYWEARKGLGGVSVSRNRA